MGFTGKNGASATALGAVRQFGLVDGLRGDIRISELGLRILEPGNKGEYIDALHEAVDQPDVYAAINAQFSEGVPRSDEPIRSFLIRTLGFSKSGADDCIASFRESATELERETSRMMVERTETAEPELQAVSFDNIATVSRDIVRREENVASSSAAEFVRIPLTRECSAELRFSGPITSDAVTRLLRYIDLMKDVWAETE